MIIDKNFILDYFQEYIFGFMYSDLENCIRAKANFAVAALLMSYTENIGGLITGNLGLIGTSKADFSTVLEYFTFVDDTRHYKDFKITLKEADQSKERNFTIYEAFRCGLIHEYFPKLPCIIHNNADDVAHYVESDAGIGWIIHKGQKTLRFHTNAYYRDFKNAVDKVFRQVFIQNDPGITTNIEKSLGRIFSRKLILPKD